MTTGEQDLPVVLCIDCWRPVHTPQARARRIGADCWRRRRREARAAAVPVVLPGLSGWGGRSVQDGPDLLSADVAGVGQEREEVVAP